MNTGPFASHHLANVFLDIEPRWQELNVDLGRPFGGYHSAVPPDMSRLAPSEPRLQDLTDKLSSEPADVDRRGLGQPDR